MGDFFDVCRLLEASIISILSVQFKGKGWLCCIFFLLSTNPLINLNVHRLNIDLVFICNILHDSKF